MKHQCNDPEVLQFFELIENIGTFQQEIAENQEQFLGVYQKDQFFGEHGSNFRHEIMKAYLNGNSEILISVPKPYLISCLDSDINNPIQDQILEVDYVRIKIFRVAIFGRDSEWYSCAATWGNGGFISKACRRNRPW